MANNVEIKARVRDVAGVAARAEALADGPARVIEQRDTFFRSASGRLKLREFGDGGGELIAYSRDDAPGPTTSDYTICPVPDPGQLRETLGQVPGVRGEVRKRRRLLLVGRTRIHLDEVDDLGHFVELEVVLADGEMSENGRAEAERLMAALGIAPDDLIDVAYIDLIETRDTGAHAPAATSTDDRSSR